MKPPCISSEWGAQKNVYLPFFSVSIVVFVPIHSSPESTLLVRGADDAEVVVLGAVGDHEPVLHACLERLHLLAADGQADRVAGPDGALHRCSMLRLPARP